MEEKTINVMELVMLAWRRLWVLILSAIVFAAATFSYCEFLVTPIWGARSSVVVTNGAITIINPDSTQNKVSASDLSASLYLIETVIDVLKTPDLYKQVADQLGSDYNYASIRGRTSVSQRSENSLFIDITVTGEDPKEAMRIANKIAQISCKYIPEIIPNSVAIDVETAISASMTYPRTFRASGIAAVLGAVAAYAILFIIESTNRAIKGAEDFTSRFDVPLLGAVPDFENAESGGYRKSKRKGGYSSGY